MKAVIIAAGEGNRLKPLTLVRSKHMIPIAGKPILEHLFIALKEAGITEVFVVVGHYKDLIQNYFEDGDKWGLKIVYFHQEKLLGTANAIGFVEEYIGNEDFLVVYGDLLIHHSVLQSAIKKHDKKGCNVLTVVSVANPQRYGVVTLEDDMVKGIIEKPKSDTANSNLINAGVYVFSKEIFQEIKKTPKKL